MEKLNLKRIKVKNIDRTIRLDMFNLFDKYYAHTNFDRFCSDLDEKDHVLTMWRNGARKNELIGFTTVRRRTSLLPEPHVYIFSGDTVMDKAYWGSKCLQKSFFWYILETKIIALNKPVFWFLISKGHKTYLLMRNNFPYSFPNCNELTPNKMKAIMDHYYKQKFPHAYCEDTNLIRFPEISEATRSQYWDIKPDCRENPDLAYFLKTNPDFSKGVELACIAEIRWGGFYHHFNKFFAKRSFSKVFDTFKKPVNLPRNPINGPSESDYKSNFTNEA